MGANAEKEETEIYKIPMHDGGEDMAVWCFILAYAPTNLFHNNLFLSTQTNDTNIQRGQN